MSTPIDLDPLARKLYSRACTVGLVSPPHTSWEYLVSAEKDRWWLLAFTAREILLGPLKESKTGQPG